MPSERERFGVLLDHVEYERSRGVQLIMAGLPPIPRVGPVNTGDKATGSKNLHINMRGASPDMLMDEEFQEYQAEKMFQWMKDNLPHGIYQRLLDKMVLADRLMLDA